ncbi:MAG: NPCBM/NEW2 domain-containing protein, partial [Pirellulales bacterium]|nr:NPCBM/NEW2 domain-containing protein [Pirellulales bacterium]
SAPLGREYALASGLMEITYKSGARVILEGPCAYQVDSSAGGFLARGKLTARIGERGEGRGEKIQQIPKSPNPQSPTPYPFVVRTPTAIVTDLGTEFGVEVDENGDTTSYVFEGKVVVKAAIRGFGDSGIRDVQLAAGESVMVGRVRAGTHHNSTAAGGTGSASGTLRFTQPTTPPKFVRRLQEPLKTLDLLDIVAGGNGTGRRRERGIDPSSGIYDPRFVWAIRDADRLYHAVRWHSFIDGVFVPDGRDGAVAIDSSEHLFDGFPTTSGQGYGSIWARGAEVDDNWSEKTSGPWVYVMGRAERFQPANRGLLCLSPNAGITFNLEAMRRAYRDVAPNKFRAVAGLVDNRNLVPTADGLADLWVFIDGTLKLKRTQLRPEHGIVLVDIEIAPDAQFLTLVSTDGGNGYANDYVVFGDPVLEMAPTDQRENMPMSN